MISGHLRPPAFVENAAGDVVRVFLPDGTLLDQLKTLGFENSAEFPDHVERIANGEQIKANVFDALRNLGIAFSGGSNWSPAEVFQYLRDKKLIGGAFLEIYWTSPELWFTRQV